MGKYIFGVDIGGTTVKCGIFGENGDLFDKWEIKTRTENNGASILPDIAATILEKCEKEGIPKRNVLGVGVTVPGPVLENGDVSFAVNLHWGYTMVARELRHMTGFAIKTGNDANAAALGEMWKGGGRGTGNMVMITLGTGVGGGVIIGGKMVHGAHGAGGELGHICMDPEDTDVCNCGNKGCLETKASATGIVRLAKRALAAYEGSTVLDPETVTSKDVFDAYNTGDPVAALVVDQVADYLGRAMAMFAATLDPEKFVIGGGVSKAGQPLLDVITKAYKKYAFPSCRDAKIALAELGNDAGIYGAAKMILDIY